MPDSFINGVGETGLSKEEEYVNRERKYSQDGGDLRKFSRGKTNSFEPSSDPFYNRKPVDSKWEEIQAVATCANNGSQNPNSKVLVRLT